MPKARRVARPGHHVCAPSDRKSNLDTGTGRAAGEEFDAGCATRTTRDGAEEFNRGCDAPRRRVVDVTVCSFVKPRERVAFS